MSFHIKACQLTQAQLVALPLPPTTPHTTPLASTHPVAYEAACDVGNLRLAYVPSEFNITWRFVCLLCVRRVAPCVHLVRQPVCARCEVSKTVGNRVIVCELVACGRRHCPPPRPRPRVGAMPLTHSSFWPSPSPAHEATGNGVIVGECANKHSITGAF
mgnify:CR=1 FL=1